MHVEILHLVPTAELNIMLDFLFFEYFGFVVKTALFCWTEGVFHSQRMNQSVWKNVIVGTEIFVRLSLLL